MNYFRIIVAGLIGEPLRLNLLELIVLSIKSYAEGLIIACFFSNNISPDATENSST